MGMIYKRGSIYWIKYYRDAVPVRESARSSRHDDAKALLRAREGAIANGEPVSPRIDRVKFRELTDAVVVNYTLKGRSSLPAVKRRLRLHIHPFLGDRRASTITSDDLLRFTLKRQEEGASNAEINRELAIIKRAFHLGMKSTPRKVHLLPAIEMLGEDNARQGFFEPEQFEAVRSHLPEPLQPVVTFAYVTGWRIPSEVLSLQWRQVDFDAGVVRLEPGTTKNRKGREFPFAQHGLLRGVLEAQRRKTDTVQQARQIICPWVFHRNGRRIRDLYGAWGEACKKAGCPSAIPHDFRRTAVRNLVRAGVPEGVAMKLTGHKTRHVFERYNIVSGVDLSEAVQKLSNSTEGAWKRLKHPAAGVSPASRS